MDSASPSDIVAALENLLAADYDRIRVRLWRQFGEQLQKIPDASRPDDLFHDAIKDLLAERRHCPLERIELTTCLVKMVRSKISHQAQDKLRDEAISSGVHLTRCLHDEIASLRSQ